MAKKKGVFEYMEEHGFEQIVYFHNRRTNLKGITCIHNTVLGPSCGGTRLWNYENEDDALYDVTRLSRGMTYKNAAAGLNLGGSKSVLIGDPKTVKSESYFRSYGRHIQGFEGRVYTGEDMNIAPRDVEHMAMETKYVNTSGDTSRLTGYGVYWGIKACAKVKYGDNSLKGKKVAIQGVGQVGYNLSKFLEQEGAIIYYTDIKQDNLDRMKNEFKYATYVELDDIYSVDCDIFSPNAIGAIINENTIDKFKCDIIAGGANNVLEEEELGARLFEKGILLAPDYVINAGGVIKVYHGMIGYVEEKAKSDVEKIYDRLLKIFEISANEKIPTNQAADKMAEDRMEEIKEMRSAYLRNEVDLV